MSRFCISFDFELHWGVADHTPAASFATRAIVTREIVIPSILELFAQREISATWATVGALMCRSKEELFELVPATRPLYPNIRLRMEAHLPDVGADESEDPLHFAPSLVSRIKDTPYQEIGSHTFGHYYVLESGSSPDAFEADLLAAIEIAARHSVSLESFVFPRNQFDQATLEQLKGEGIKCARVNPDVWYLSARRYEDEHTLQRIFRFLDSLVVPTHSSETDSQAGLTLTHASCFLRPRVGPQWLNEMRLQSIFDAMTEAAQNGRDFHLWFHPHNFGRKPTENLAMLEALIDHFEYLRETFGMRSVTMAQMGEG